MELTTIRELFKNREEYLDKKVTVGGWIRSIRDSKTFGFIVMNDGSYFDTLQIVYHDSYRDLQAERGSSRDRDRYSGGNSSGEAAVRDPGG